MISYIIVSYNTTEFTRNTIASIMEHCTDHEIIVVDNNSPDTTVNDIRNQFSSEIGKSLQVIACDENHGFSKANNIGAKQAKGDFLVFINPDTVVMSDIGKEMLNLVDTEFKNRKVIVSPQILNPDLTKQHCVNLFPIINVKSVFKKISKIMRSKLPIKFIKADWITGVCLCMKRDVYDMLGGWNEYYDLYSEDLDICYKLKERYGGKIILSKEHKLIHYGNQSGKKVYKTNYSLYKKKMDALKKFYMLYLDMDKFKKLLKFYQKHQPSEELEIYYGENFSENEE